MKNIILEKYKLINVILFVFVFLLVLVLYKFVQAGYCIDNCSLEVKKGIINPIYLGGRWLAGILAVLLLLPSKLFRLWLFYIAPVFLLLTYFLVQGISVYSTNLLNPTRGQMAENCMIALAVVTLVFVIGRCIYDWKKKK